MTLSKSNLLMLALVAGLALGALALNFDTLLLHPATRLPGSPDDSAYNLLHLWWPVASLSQADEPVIHSFIGAPYLTNHLRNMPMLQSVLFTALKGLGPVLAFNILLVFSQLATQLIIFWYLKRKGLPGPWAALAATAFVLSPWYSQVIAQADLISAGGWLLPLALIIWDRWVEQPSPWRVALVGLVLYAAVLCGVQNLLWVVSLWLPYAAWSLWRQHKVNPQFFAATRDQTAALGLSFLVLCLLYPIPVIVRTLQGNEPAYGPALSAPVLRSFIGWVLRTSPAIFVLATATALWARPRVSTYGWLVIAGVMAAVGFGLIPDPLNMVASALGLPYLPLAERDFFFGIALFALLSYISAAWSETWQTANASQPRAWLVIWVVALGLVLAGNPDGLRAVPTNEVNVPVFYSQIASEPEDYLLLEYPFGLASVADSRTLGSVAYMARNSVWDYKRSVSGLSPFYTDRVFEKETATQFLFPDKLTDDNRQQAAQALGVAIREWRIGYVVVHSDLLSVQTLSALRDLLAHSEALCPPVVRDGLTLYRAQWHPYGCPGA